MTITDNVIQIVIAVDIYRRRQLGVKNLPQRHQRHNETIYNDSQGNGFTSSNQKAKDGEKYSSLNIVFIYEIHQLHRTFKQ